MATAVSKNEVREIVDGSHLLFVWFDENNIVKLHARILCRGRLEVWLFANPDTLRIVENRIREQDSEPNITLTIKTYFGTVFYIFVIINGKVKMIEVDTKNRKIRELKRVSPDKVFKLVRLSTMSHYGLIYYDLVYKL